MEIIEFLGLSRAGKTTQQEAIAHILESEGHRCHKVQRPQLRFKDCTGLEDFHTRLFDIFRRGRDDADQARNDFVIFDRGFYDRLVMLSADYQDNGVSEPFYERMSKEIQKEAQTTRYPFLFRITPETSLARWEEQQAKGMDYSALCAGLDTRDRIEGLQMLQAKYESLGKRAGFIPVNAEQSQEAVTYHLNRAIIRKATTMAGAA